jgi:hypothetical protein
MRTRARLPNYLTRIPPRTTLRVSHVTSTKPRYNDLLYTDRSFLSASWPRERTRLEAELKNSTIDREYVYDWAIGGLRRETEQEAWARINGKTDDKISSDKQTNMRRNQDIELAENGSQVMSADDETVGRLVPQASFAVQNTRTASPTQQGSKKSLRKRIAIAINPVL